MSDVHPRSLARLAPAAALVLASLAFAPPTFAQAGQGEVGAICSRVLGLAPQEKHFAACEQSLWESLRGLRQGEGWADARRGCLDEGYRPGTSGLAECEVAAGREDGWRGPDPEQLPAARSSYFETSREGVFARIERACAALGFEPAQAPFSDCTANLRAALARASEPAM